MTSSLQPQFRSRFGGLWIDRNDSEQILAERIRDGQISKQLGDKIASFIRDGFVILKGAVSKDETSALRKEIEDFYINPPSDALVETYDVPGSQGVQWVRPEPKYKYGTTKLLGFHGWSARMRKAVANAATIEFLAAIFDDKPKAFGGLTFWRGSEQSIHKDTAYVEIDSQPMHMAASWLALEDISPGTGELEYYVASHKSPDYLFAGHSKSVKAAPHEDPIFLKSLHEDAERESLVKGSFLAEEGDVLIWHADLAHGGAKITQPGLSRQSHVTHFTTAADEPPYNLKLQRRPYDQDGCLFISEWSEIK